MYAVRGRWEEVSKGQDEEKEDGDIGETPEQSTYLTPFKCVCV